MKKLRIITCFGIVFCFLGLAIWMSYRQGYKDAEFKRWDSDMRLSMQYLDEIAELQSQKKTPTQKLFDSLKIDETFESANKALTDAGYRMMDYLTPHDDDTYDTHWLDTKGETEERQTWIALTQDKKTNLVVSKELMVRRKPK